MDTLEIKNNIISHLNTARNVVELSNIEKFQDEFFIYFQEIHDLTNEELEIRVRDFFGNRNGSLVYIIELINTNEHKLIFESFKSAKIEKRGNRAYSKINEQHQSNNCLYVGSSMSKNVTTRIRNHFGLGSRSVYSLHFLNWFPKIPNGKLKISLFKVIYPKHESEILNIPELFEQSLWDINKPMFGKRSGRL